MSILKNNPRIPVEETVIEKTKEIVSNALLKRLKQHGYDSFSSIHEILGIMDEEHYELLMAVHKNDDLQVKEELVDIAVGALFGIATLIAKENDNINKNI
jgi:NTP pyrophosphatase (non-canonical NTP hydrolase)